MKAIISIFLLFVICSFLPCSVAEAEDKQRADQPPSPSQIWDGVKNDWKKIGEGAREAGVDIGRTISGEAKEVPKQVQKGIQETQKDFKKITGQSETNH